jgi:hypothetical protein
MVEVRRMAQKLTEFLGCGHVTMSGNGQVSSQYKT